jgi:hypothetical protein
MKILLNFFFIFFLFSGLLGGMYMEELAAEAKTIGTLEEEIKQTNPAIPMEQSKANNEAIKRIDNLAYWIYHSIKTVYSTPRTAVVIFEDNETKEPISSQLINFKNDLYPGPVKTEQHQVLNEILAFKTSNEIDSNGDYFLRFYGANEVSEYFDSKPVKKTLKEFFKVPEDTSTCVVMMEPFNHTLAHYSLDIATNDATNLLHTRLTLYENILTGLEMVHDTYYLCNINLNNLALIKIDDYKASELNERNVMYLDAYKGRKHQLKIQNSLGVKMGPKPQRECEVLEPGFSPIESTQGVTFQEKFDLFSVAVVILDLEFRGVKLKSFSLFNKKVHEAIDNGGEFTTEIKRFIEPLKLFVIMKSNFETKDKKTSSKSFIKTEFESYQHLMREIGATKFNFKTVDEFIYKSPSVFLFFLYKSVQFYFSNSFPEEKKQILDQLLAEQLHKIEEEKSKLNDTAQNTPEFEKLTDEAHIAHHYHFMRVASLSYKVNLIMETIKCMNGTVGDRPSIPQFKKKLSNIRNAYLGEVQQSLDLVHEYEDYILRKQAVSFSRYKQYDQFPSPQFLRKNRMVKLI